MENKIMFDLVKKQNYEKKKMDELDEQWFNEKIDFDTSMKIRQDYEEHRKKYKFYKKMIENMKKGDRQ